MRAITLSLLTCLAFAPTSHAADITYWVEPCTKATTGCVGGDTDLARWAFEAWEKASEGKLRFVETKNRDDGRIRVRWADRDSGLFGEAVPINVNGQRGAELHILIANENADGSGKSDSLMRDAVLYLTCLHESGHALGLNHTRAFADIMYNFQYGGNIPEYFGRYRRKLTRRDDIRSNSGMSPADQRALIESIAKGILR
ncbi:MAG: matrixin family metalloprotease [Bryobacteraceae bacterium]